MKSEEFSEEFLWKGLRFWRTEKESPLLAHYEHGRWRVHAEIQLPGELRDNPVWRARWEAHPSQLLTGNGIGDTPEKALDMCLLSLRTNDAKHDSYLEELQERVASMMRERNALIIDLLELTR